LLVKLFFYPNELTQGHLSIRQLTEIKKKLSTILEKYHVLETITQEVFDNFYQKYTEEKEAIEKGLCLKLRYSTRKEKRDKLSYRLFVPFCGL
jgi:hypothetical protein